MNENGTHQDISLKELAAYCGLSSATVSDVINGKARQKRISAKTETRVLDAAKRLGYRTVWRHVSAAGRILQSESSSRTRLMLL